ncbi:MAG: cyclopropane-fatty-acyl-phospholipid synthase [Rickettsiales bacterium]|nr:cyclopropane-fatty-acyl-phospholipid synthase [Pseudomonadota bacterium]MDA0966203.1 cyclopropane-fatty-acyl-phospholipid synthase [Pseudomonadota bacterium]MDG4543132.1 cyclopropane-fatty-acyl-phospholipid synthase [Rickettsiales bacterium]MDG4545330.1 cyclopropane-fatty-acyl-phospholipid synthase [Rickettsiales bacterium]MDG4547779.1 cyclopropane-fatty-acyl-phospholipid synthase [Rickettsiales bacterium]
MLEKQVINKFLQQLEKIQYGSVGVTTPDGKKYYFAGKNSATHADLKIHDYRAITNLLAKGDIGFAESYRDGLFDSDNLENLLTVALQNAQIMESYLYGGKFSGIMAQLLYYMRSNTLKGSRRNIQAHYDLGNDFYSLWLDPTMSYSAAIFKDENEPLVQAQHNKYDRIINSLDTNSGSLLEVGCGWGGFADRAVEKGDFALKGITISNQQYHYAKERLKNNADIVLEDYRKLEGRYDNIVSIEMFEAVGEKFWTTYFSKMKSLLSQKGKAVIQTITIDEQYFERYRKTGDMVRSFIFPGGMLPSVTRFKQEAAKEDLNVKHIHSFGQDYAKTLKHWSKSFESNLPKIRKIGFDEKFIRLWRFYLCACTASFTAGRTNVVQAELSHA